MLIIMDDVVGNPTFENDCINILESNKNITNEINFWEKWYSLDEEHVFQDFCVQMINVAGNFFDLTSCISYEFWSQNYQIYQTLRHHYFYWLQRRQCCLEPRQARFFHLPLNL